MSRLPESQIARVRVAGLAAAKVGIGQLKHKAKRPFLSLDEQQKQERSLEDHNAEIVFKALSQLRGTAVKLGQMIGMETDLLPESYRRELKKSWHQVPPLNRVLVRKVIQEEFDTTPEAIFVKFDDVAFAAASLGQVHAAQLEEGAQVVVKIQYPGINATLDSDIALLRKLMVGFPNKKLLMGSIDEVQARLIEETNYRLEMETTRWFNENLKIAGVKVPEVYPTYCGKRVVTTERISGMHLDDWLDTRPSQDERNRAAQLIYDTFVESSMTLGRLHADPNPGNYLFSANGDIGLIDFGCTKVLSKKFIELFPNLMRAYAGGNMNDIVEANAALGMRFTDLDEDTWESLLKPFAEWLSEPFQSEYFDFQANGNYTSKAKELLHKMTELPNLDAIADDFIFFDRTIYGLCKIFERLGASIRMRHHWFNS